MNRKRPPFAQIIIALGGLAVLIGLGTWQVQRLQWKNAIIAQLSSAYERMDNNGATLATPDQIARHAVEDQILAVLRVQGQFNRQKAVFLGPRTLEGRVGYHLLLPLRLDDDTTLMVNTGWVDNLWKDDPVERLAILPSGHVSVTGVLRKPEWNRFTSGNSPSQDLWLRPDLAEIGAARALPGLHPLMLYASVVEPPLPGVVPIDPRWMPRNQHKQYALFWYGMALVLITVFALYWRSRSR